MEHVFAIYTPGGDEIERYPADQDRETLEAEILERVAANPWCRVQYHLCRDQERQPCDQWELVAEFGDVPDPTEATQ